MCVSSIVLPFDGSGIRAQFLGEHFLVQVGAVLAQTAKGLRGAVAFWSSNFGTLLPRFWRSRASLSNRIQLTTDGHRVYLDVVESAFGSGIDYSMLVKLYGNNAESEVRYSPAECIGTRIIPIIGQPNPKHISTSYVERQNLTMRIEDASFHAIDERIFKES